MTSPAKRFWPAVRNLQDRIRNQPGWCRPASATPEATLLTRHMATPTARRIVEAVYDPERIDFREVLQYFFSVHDPTTKDRQGKDIGRRYRSAIFYLDDGRNELR